MHKILAFAVAGLLLFFPANSVSAANSQGSVFGESTTDVCPNLDGVQTVLPIGYVLDPKGVCLDPRPADIQPLVQGHNIVSADRINLVVAGMNFASLEELKASAIEMLSWNGSPVRNGVAFGPFAIEPLRSNKNKFNVWYDSVLIDGDTPALLEYKSQDRKGAIQRSGLTYVVPIFINKELPNNNTFITPHADSFGIRLENNSFASLAKSNLNPAAVYVNTSLLTAPSQLAHELGHGIFGLADEKTDAPYQSDPNAIPRIQPPDCVATLADAQALWGSMIGQMDPFYYEWRNTLERNGQWSTLFPADVQWWKNIDQGLRVGYYYGQCYGYTQGTNVIRPTDYSIMNQSQIAVFGSVNRRQIETILGFFSGSTTPARLVAVGAYTGSNHANGRSKVTVNVSAGSQPIVLALSAYDPVDWTIVNPTGRTIQKVIASGYHRQGVSGQGLVPTETYSYDERTAYAYAYRNPSTNYNKLATFLKGKTGLDISEFQGMYWGSVFTTPIPTPRLVAIGAYTGSNHTNGRSSITVNIAAGTSPLILSLSAYDPVDWTIVNPTGRTIQKVIASGYHSQTVTGQGTTPTETFSYDQGNGYAYAYSNPSTSYTNLANFLKVKTGLDVSEFQGTYWGASFTAPSTPLSSTTSISNLAAALAALQELLKSWGAQLGR